MKYRTLGRTDLKVSEICLGTMTWGEQNSAAEAQAQLDYAIDQGVNFIDTAEIYPVPLNSATSNRTEQYIGNWLTKRGKRDDLIIATKVAGKSPMDWLRPDKQLSDLTPSQIALACESSLRRLQIDCIDLYQVHWPSRSVPIFGQNFFPLDCPREDGVPIAETLGAMDKLIQEGKIRHVGLSNETPWGTMEYIRLAETRGLARVVSVQNPYHLISRGYERAMAEVSIHEDVGLLVYSPLASGLLSGKYLDGAQPEGARLTRWPDKFRSSQATAPATEQCVQEHVALAHKHGLDPSQMAIAYSLAGNFVTASIIGATNLDQLKTDISASDVVLSSEVLGEIAEIGSRFCGL